MLSGVEQRITCTFNRVLERHCASAADLGVFLQISLNDAVQSHPRKPAERQKLSGALNVCGDAEDLHILVEVSVENSHNSSKISLSICVNSAHT